MLTEEALKKQYAAHEEEMRTLEKKAAFHQEQVVGHNNELRACQSSMIHLDGAMQAIKKMLAPAEPAALQTTVTESPSPARSRRKR